MKQNHRAQVTIEHLIVWSMIVTVVVWGLLVYFKPAVRTATEKLADRLDWEQEKCIEEWDD